MDDPRGAETILLVDDEKFVRDFGRKMFRRAGCAALTPANGREALDLHLQEMAKIS